MSKYTDNWELAYQDNTAKQCSVRWCFQPRDSISKYCKEHKMKDYRLGDARMHQTVREKDYRVERDQVREVINKNPEHPAIVKALETIQAMFQEGADAFNPPRDGNSDLPAAYHLGRLYYHNVDPIEVLVRAAALWLYQFRYPDRLPSKKALTFTLGWRTLLLIPMERMSDPGKGRRVYRYPKESEKRELGEYLWNRVVGIIATMIVEKVREEEREYEERSRLARIPLQ
jgi:hypothetical protein